jgi:phosphatidylinositol-3-phosphatase
MSKRLVLGLSVVVMSSLTVVGVQFAAAQASSRGAAQAKTSMCGVRSSAGSYKHVIVIFEENNPYNSIYKSSAAPYINSVINQCGLATNYHNITHPSLPNYLAATTGATLAQLHTFYTAPTADCTPSAACEWTGNNIFEELNIRHRLWRGYAESMPFACAKANSGPYAPRHNPAVYDTDLSNCSTDDVPLGTTSSSRLLKDFASSAKAPAYATLTPNLCHDMHGIGSCPSGSLITAGDNWLKLWLPKITATPVYRAGQTVIFITWDEGEPASGSAQSGEACAANTTDQSCHVVTIVVAPSVKHGKKVATLFNHYSLLKSSEDLLGLPEIGSAKTAKSMVGAFGL